MRGRRTTGPTRNCYFMNSTLFQHGDPSRSRAQPWRRMRRQPAAGTEPAPRQPGCPVRPRGLANAQSRRGSKPLAAAKPASPTARGRRGSPPTQPHLHVLRSVPRFPGRPQQRELEWRAAMTRDVSWHLWKRLRDSKNNLLRESPSLIMSCPFFSDFLPTSSH